MIWPGAPRVVALRAVAIAERYADHGLGDDAGAVSRFLAFERQPTADGGRALGVDSALLAWCFCLAWAETVGIQAPDRSNQCLYGSPADPWLAIERLALPDVREEMWLADGSPREVMDDAAGRGRWLADDCSAGLRIKPGWIAVSDRDGDGVPDALGLVRLGAEILETIEAELDDDGAPIAVRRAHGYTLVFGYVRTW
jgi:hypothetical protein